MANLKSLLLSTTIVPNTAPVGSVPIIVSANVDDVAPPPPADPTVDNVTLESELKLTKVAGAETVFSMLYSHQESITARRVALRRIVTQES